MRVISSKIEEFLSTLNLGLEWIGDAGKKLVSILDDDSHAFEDILEVTTSRWLTRDVLQTLEAIGRGEISPEALILPVHVFKRLVMLPTDEQIIAMQGVDVAVGRIGEETVVRKHVAELNQNEAKRVIGPNGIRTPEQQLANKPYNGGGSAVGKYQIVIVNGQEPRLERVIRSDIPDFQKQRVKLVNGCALIELYL